MFSLVTHKRIYYLKDNTTKKCYSSASSKDLKKICKIINELQENHTECQQKTEAIKQLLQ